MVGFIINPVPIIVAGGYANGAVMPATILDRIISDMDIYDEEASARSR